MIVVIIVAGSMLYIKSGSWGVTETSEARYAEISREMALSGDLIHPTLLGIGHYHKPPLTYIITAASYKLWGVNPFAVRFFLQIAAVFQMMLIYGIGKLLFRDKRTAWSAAVIYISFPAVLISTRALTTDAFLATFILAAIFCRMKYRTSGRPVFLYTFYLCLALGFLTKGPLVLILPVIITMEFNKCELNKNSKPVHHFIAFIIFILIGFSWFLKLVWDNPRFSDYFLVHHLYQRFTVPSAFNRSGPFWYYLLIVPAISFPWFFLVTIQFFKNGLAPLKSDRRYRLLFMWIFPVLFLFSLSSSKLILYVLPIFPGVALASAYFLDKFKYNVLRLWIKIQTGYHILVLTAVVFIPLLKPQYELGGEVIALSVILLLYVTIIPCLHGLSMHLKIIITAMGFTLGLAIITAFLFSRNPSLTNSTQNLAIFIKKQGLDDRPVLIYNMRLPSIAFHLNKNIISLADGHHSLNRETQFESNENWKRQLINLKSDRGLLELSNYLNREAILITGPRLPENRKWITENYKDTVSLGKWKIFYNP